MKQKAVVLSPKDNVATALSPLESGDKLELKIEGKTFAVTVKSDIPFGHKFSLARIQKNSPVVKYGEVIGTATKNISPGDYVHVNNVVSTRGRGDLERKRK
ncbi:MAG: hypothetical protein FJ045_06610 [Crenarchaeota archaeon]|nr:hypothetical protein [Thermoproteota archaeon]